MSCWTRPTPALMESLNGQLGKRTKPERPSGVNLLSFLQHNADIATDTARALLQVGVRRITGVDFASSGTSLRRGHRTGKAASRGMEHEEMRMSASPLPKAASISHHLNSVKDHRNGTASLVSEGVFLTSMIYSSVHLLSRVLNACTIKQIKSSWTRACDSANQIYQPFLIA